MIVKLRNKNVVFLLYFLTIYICIRKIDNYLTSRKEKKNNTRRNIIHLQVSYRNSKYIVFNTTNVVNFINTVDI